MGGVGGWAGEIDGFQAALGGMKQPETGVLLRYLLKLFYFQAA